jgi:hypothetical protein
MAYLAQPCRGRHISLQPCERALVVLQIGAVRVAAAADGAALLWNVMRIVMFVLVEE